VSPGTGHKTRSSILYRLYSVQQLTTDTSKRAVAVVETAVDKGMNECLSCLRRQTLFDRPVLTYGSWKKHDRLSVAMWSAIVSWLSSRTPRSLTIFANRTVTFGSQCIGCEFIPLLTCSQPVSCLHSASGDYWQSILGPGWYSHRGASSRLSNLRQACWRRLVCRRRMNGLWTRTQQWHRIVQPCTAGREWALKWTPQGRQIADEAFLRGVLGRTPATHDRLNTTWSSQVQTHKSQTY